MVQVLRNSGQHDLFFVIGGVLVGGGWFAFGWYGGLPLVETVSDWRPPTAPGELTEVHRRGLRTMRRRSWISMLLAPRGQAPLAVLLVGVPLAIVKARYLLSRCPRCGTCRHCGLSLDADKVR